MPGIPTKPPTTKDINWGAVVRRYWGDAWHKKETGYEFSNGRKFDDPGQSGGPYTGTGT